jgi:hypothetical protein
MAIFELMSGNYPDLVGTSSPTQVFGSRRENRKRLIAKKAALQPKPVTLLDDVLRIMLSNLQEEESVDDQAVNLHPEVNFRTRSSIFQKFRKSRYL